MKFKISFLAFTSIFSFMSCKMETAIRQTTFEPIRETSGFVTHGFSIPLNSEDRQVSAKDIDVHFVVDDSESLETILDTKVKAALKNLAPTLGKVEKANFKFYRLSDIDSGRQTVEVIDGNKTIKTHTFMAPKPVAEMTTESSMELSQIQEEIEEAIDKIQFKEFFSDEKGLCYLMRLANTGIIQNTSDKAQVLTLITNENDWKFEDLDSTNRCIWKTVHTSERKNRNKDPNLFVEVDSIEVKGFYRDSKNEKHNYSKVFHIKNGTHFSQSLFNSLSNAQKNCSQQTIDAIKRIDNVTLRRCKINSDKANRFSDLRTFGGILKYLLDNYSINPCNVSNFSFNGKNYSDVEEVIADYLNVSPSSVNNCRHNPARVESYVDNDYDHTYFNAMTMTENLAKGISYVVDNFSDDTKKLFSTLMIYYDQDNTQCNDQEKAFNEHGLAYQTLNDELASLDLTVYQGDICDNDYNKIFEESIGKEIEKFFTLKYAIEDYPSNVLAKTLKVYLSGQNGNYILNESQYSISADQEGKTVLELKPELDIDLKEYSEIKVLVETQL